MYMPSRAVARVGVDALDSDRGLVVAGLPTRIATHVLQLVPRRILLPVLARQNPGLRRTHD